MSVVVRIPTAWQYLFEGRNQWNVEATSLREAINTCDDEFRCRLIDEKGQLRRFNLFYVNEVEVSKTTGLETTLNDGDEIVIALPIPCG
jgi:molybdopterin converting factor small subunit